MSYQNVSVEDGRSKFVQVEPVGTLSELIFTAKRASVPLGSGIRVNVANAVATLNRKVNVAADGDVPVYFTRGIKLSFNDLGDTASIDEMLADLLAFVATARASYNLDNGLVPPSSVTFTEPV